MPLLKESNLQEIADKLLKYYLAFEEKAKYYAYSYAAYFGKEDSYMVFSEYTALCGHSLSFTKDKQKIIDILEKELNRKFQSSERVDVVIVWGEFDMWKAVEKDEDGKKCFAKCQETNYLIDPHEDDNIACLIKEFN